MLSQKEALRHKFAQADFTDDVMFGLIMSQPEICKRFLQAVLPAYDFDHIKVTPQKYLKTSYVTRAGRLDLLCTNENGTQFNVELQMVDEHNLAKRSRYYHALLANNMLAPGEDYQNLKETYVIFLCGFDPFGLGWAVTDYQMTANHGKHILGDGTHTLILNAKGDWREVNDELKGIFQLVLKQRATYGHLGLEIARNIKDFKESKAGGGKYMALAGEFWQNVWEDARKAGREEGREEGRKEIVLLFVQKLAKDGQSQPEIMTYLETELGLSKDEAQEYYQLAMTKA